MQRINTSTKAVDLFGSGKHGFKDGAGVDDPSTRLNAAFFNPIQEEPCNIIEAMGLTVGYGNDQLLKALIAADMIKAAAAGAAFDEAEHATNDFFCVGSGPSGGVVAGGLDKYWLNPSTGVFQSTSTINIGTMRAVLHCGNTYGFVGAGGSAIETSPTGETWSSRVNGATPGGFLSVAYRSVNDIVVAVGGTIPTDALIYRSIGNISTWAAQTAAMTGSIRSVACNGTSMFVAVGDTGIQSSPDGTTWTQRSALTGYQWVTWSAFHGAFFAVRGAVSPSVQYSTDGITWNTAYASAHGLSSVILSGVASRAGLLVLGNSPQGKRVLFFPFSDSTSPTVIGSVFEGGVVPMFAAAYDSYRGGIWCGGERNRLSFYPTPFGI